MEKLKWSMQLLQRIYPETSKSNRLKDSIKRGNKLSFKSNDLYQITSANNINSKRLYKNKYEIDCVQKLQQ